MIEKIKCPDCEHEFIAHSEQGHCIHSEGKCFKCLGYSVTDDAIKRIVLQVANDIHFCNSKKFVRS